MHEPYKQSGGGNDRRRRGEAVGAGERESLGKLYDRIYVNIINKYLPEI